jgi:type VI secretion system protein ImpH
MLRHYGDFNVFQLMRLLLADAQPDMPMEQVLRFRADLSASFPANEFSHVRLTGVAPDSDTDHGTQLVEITTANFCIASVLGPLPEPFTEWLRDLQTLRSTAMADFLDIFNQRINLLRFRIKRMQTIGLQAVAPEETEMAYGLSALMGLVQPQLGQQVPLPERSWLGLAGLLANRRKQATTVVQILSLALGTQVRLIPFIGAWQEIAAQDRCALGRRNSKLGRNSVIGRRVWDQQARIRLHIGVVDYDRLCRLLPPTALQQHANVQNIPAATAQESDFDMFSGLLKLLVDRLADCEIDISVSTASIPSIPLAQPARRNDFSSMRLGQSAWLKSRPDNPMATRRMRYLIPTTTVQGLR